MPFVCGPAIIKWLISCRNQLALFICLGFMISSGMRCNLGFAVIQMTANLKTHGGVSFKLHKKLIRYFYNFIKTFKAVIFNILCDSRKLDYNLRCSRFEQR